MSVFKALVMWLKNIWNVKLKQMVNGQHFNVIVPQTHMLDGRAAMENACLSN